MKINYLNRIGRSHIHDNKPCDDAVYISTSGDVVCVADGVSNSSMGGLGASSLVNNIGRYVSRSNVKVFLENGAPDEIRTNICSAIEKVMKQLCQEHKASADDFASTLLVAVKTSDKHITLLHAGDGAIFGKPRTNQETTVSILSMPDNAANGAVYPAHDCLQKERMRVIRICEDDYDTIALCTDGFSDSYLKRDYFDPYSVSEALSINDNDSLDRLVDERHIALSRITDDISCVILHLHDSELVAKRDYTAPNISGPQVIISSKDKATSDNAHKKRKKQPQRGYESVTKTLYTALLIMLTVFFVVSQISSGKRIDALKEENASQSEAISILTSQISEAHSKLGALEQALSEHKEQSSPQPDTPSAEPSSPDIQDDLTE